MKYLIVILSSLIMASCWAPRCPMNTCGVRMEHTHSDQVSGVFSGRLLHPPRLHYLWDKNKGEANPETGFQPDGLTRKQKKARKKFPWERW